MQPGRPGPQPPGPGLSSFLAPAAVHHRLQSQGQYNKSEYHPLVILLLLHLLFLKNEQAKKSLRQGVSLEKLSLGSTKGAARGNS